MKAFLSHASADKAFVLEVYNALEPHTLWLDRAEIEWGNQFLEKLEEGIKIASDFVLFWSKSSAISDWVKLEINMAFMELIGRRAIRFRIIRLDHTNLPLSLQPFNYLSVAESRNPVNDVVSALRQALNQPTEGVRHRFLNRNSELDRIEEMINDPETRVVLLRGFQGIGKGALANEAFRRFFEGASIVEIPVSPGVGPRELALRLHHEAFATVLPELSGLEALAAIESALKAIVLQGRFLIFRNGHHWLDGDGNLEDPLPTVLRQAASMTDTSRRPIFITTTRFLRFPSNLSRHISVLAVDGLREDHMASLVSLWFEWSTGSPLERDQASTVASQLHGHPVAAKIASNLIAQYGVQHLLAYPRELTALRRDLAKTLLSDLRLSQHACNLMEVLAIIGVPLPSRVLVEALATNEESFQDAVGAATSAGIAETTDSGYMRIHPLVSDYFWRSHLDRADYRERAGTAAIAVHNYFRVFPTEAAGFVPLLQAVFRLYAISNNLEEGRKIRGDLMGELAQVAIAHYNRRQFELSETYINEVLSTDPQNWRMRQYLARIRIRQRRWNDADELIEALLRERPRDTGIRHVQGWKLLREGRFEEALRILMAVLANREHVASLRDAAECLYHLRRVPEALSFLQRAKQVESDNPYTLDLEARIYEEAGEYERALAAANLAVVRNPGAWGLRHRRARILSALGRAAEAVTEAAEAVRLDPEQFVARGTFVSLLLDSGQAETAITQIESLDRLAINGNQKQIATHLSARALYLSGDLGRSLEIVERQIRRRVNLAPSYGLLVQIRLAEYARLSDSISASAQLLLQQAKSALADCEAQGDHDPEIINELRKRIAGLAAAN